MSFALGESFAAILTETTQSLICVLDRDARILLFNDACEHATGYAREELLGKDAREFVIPPEERAAFDEFLAYVFRTGSPSPQVGHWRTKAGGRRLIAWSNRLLTDDGGAPAAVVTSGLDLTAHRQAPQQQAFEGDPQAKLAEIGRLAAQQRALRRVATLVAAEASPEAVFTAVSEECARILEVNSAVVMRYAADGTATIVGRYNRDNVELLPLGHTFDARPTSAVGGVLQTGQPQRIDDWGLQPVHGDVAEAIATHGYRSSAAAPVIVANGLWGAVAITSADALPEEAEERLRGFAELVSLAVASAQARADLIASRTRLIAVGDEQRRRLERNLHDGAQQHLVAAAVKLRVARARVSKDADQAAELLDDALAELGTGLEELREIARGLHPAILSEQGLARALQVLADRLPLRVDTEIVEQRLPPAVEATAYYIVSEALTNVVKHAGADAARVSVRRDGGVARIAVSDDGRGGVDTGAGTGIVGLRDRAQAAGGTLSVVSLPGRGTVLSAVLPLSSE